MNIVIWEVLVEFLKIRILYECNRKFGFFLNVGCKFLKIEMLYKCNIETFCDILAKFYESWMLYKRNMKTGIFVGFW